MYPPVLTIEVDGIGSRTWFGSEKKIHWEDIASLHYNTGNNQVSVRDNKDFRLGLNSTLRPRPCTLVSRLSTFSTPR